MQRLTALQAGLVLLLSVCSCPALAKRNVLQEAISNSNGCLNDIPKCEQYACVTRNIKGVARWACQRCQGSYQAVVDDSGQDNIIQCVCPRGTFENTTANPALTTCARCPSGSFCLGGDRVEAPTSRGAPTACGNGLITRNTGARSQSDCVAPKGFAMTAPDQAEPCERSSYAPQYNRLGKCLRCQSGLEEPIDSGLGPGGRDTKRNVCKVPPGRYMSQGLVRICPQGFYRAEYKQFDDPTAQVCVACNPGITTANAGAGFPYLCNVVAPGYGIANVTYVDGTLVVPALPAEASTAGYPTASLCGLGFYSSGGNCLQCPQRTVTTRLGALAAEECVVPPGYFLPTAAASNMTLCPDGTYREGWLLAADTRAGTCTPCGQGISSEARELDVNPMVAAGTTSYVRATSASCYIEPGQGMIADGRNSFVGRDCPKDTYGVSGRVYGLMAAPCKPCPRNMITDNRVKVNSSDVCINPDGFGYASEGASRCAPGFYSAKGSRKPCQQCAPGRSTLDLPAAQSVIEHCLVRQGFGVASSVRNTTDAFSIDTSALNATQLAALSVLECPVGTYGEGGSAGAKCLLCPAGSTTEAPGAISSSNCTVCMPGYGRATPSALCTPCPLGYYQPGGMSTCSKCPNSTFYPPVDNRTAGDAYTSTGITTFLGATGQESCVPKETQLSPEAGQAYFSSSSAAAAALQGLLTETVANSLNDCIATCEATACCLAQYSTDTKQCKRATLTPVAADAAGLKLLYKLPPSTLGSASSLKRNVTGANAVVRVKMMSSGIYARAAIADDKRANWLSVGTNLDPTARTFSSAVQTSLWRTGSEQDCKTLCDNSNVCWGFLFDGTTCLFRGGEDALKTRSFFVLPSGDLSAFNWQGATLLDFAVGRVLSLATAQGLAVTKQQVVDALTTVFASSGTYDTDKALLTLIAQGTPDADAAALKAAVEELLKLAANQNPPVAVTGTEAEQVLRSQLPAAYDVAAALQTIIDSRASPTALAGQVWALQDAARDKPLINPTWSQAVAVLRSTRPDATSWDKSKALEVFAGAVELIPQVLDVIKKAMDGPPVSHQQALDSLLYVYLDPAVKALDVDQAAVMLTTDMGVVDKALLLALEQRALVTRQHAWDAVRAMRSLQEDIKEEAVVARLLKVNDVATQLSASQSSEDLAATTWEQRLSVVTQALADSKSGVDPTTAMKLAQKWLGQTLDVTKKVAADARLVDAGVTAAQVMDLVLLAQGHQRVYPEKFVRLYVETVLLPAPDQGAVKQLVDQLKKESNTDITPADAFSALVDTSGLFGAAGPKADSPVTARLVAATIEQLQSRGKVLELSVNALSDNAYVDNKYTQEEVNAAVSTLYRRSGYWPAPFDASMVGPTLAAYIDLTRTSGSLLYSPGLAAAVSILQTSAQTTSLSALPTWTQAVAALASYASPDKPYETGSATELFKKALDLGLRVVERARGSSSADANRQQATTLLLAVYHTDVKTADDAAVEAAVDMYLRSNEVVNTAMLNALTTYPKALVSKQTVWDMINAMRGGTTGDPTSVDAVVDQLQKLDVYAKDVKAAVAKAASQEIADAMSTEQVMSVIISVLADNKGRPGLSSHWDGALVLSVERVKQTVEVARALAASKALKDQGVQLSQAIDLALLGWAHHRVAWQKFTDAYTSVLLPDATQKVAEKMAVEATVAFGALVDVSGQIGALADSSKTAELVTAAVRQLESRADVGRKAWDALQKNAAGYTEAEIVAALDAVYRRVGYSSSLDTSVCAAYIDLVRNG